MVFDPAVGVSPAVPLPQEPLQHPADPCMRAGSLHTLHLFAWCESLSVVYMCNYILELQFVDTCTFAVIFTSKLNQVLEANMKSH